MYAYDDHLFYLYTEMECHLKTTTKETFFNEVQIHQNNENKFSTNR